MRLGSGAWAHRSGLRFCVGRLGGARRVRGSEPGLALGNDALACAGCLVRTTTDEERCQCVRSMLEHMAIDPICISTSVLLLLSPHRSPAHIVDPRNFHEKSPNALEHRHLGIWHLAHCAWGPYVPFAADGVVPRDESAEIQQTRSLEIHKLR